MARNRQQRRQAPAPPPTAGAVDLQHMKGGDKAAQRRIWNDMLRQRGLLCSCGEPFGDEGVQVEGGFAGLFPEAVMGPRGPQLIVQDGVRWFHGQFHSRACPHYLEALKSGIDTGDPSIANPKVLVVRSLPPITWLGPPEGSFTDPEPVDEITEQEPTGEPMGDGVELPADGVERTIELPAGVDA